MKAKTKVFSAVLICAVLAGCASGARVHETVPRQIEMPETVPPTELWTAPEIPELTQIPVVTAMPTEAAASFEVTIDPVITTQQKQVTVTTADEFLAAIAPDTEIVVDASLIVLNEATGYGEAKGPYYYWSQTYDGPELYIAGVSNLTIRGGGEDHAANVISSVPRYSNVLNFLNCSNILVKGLTAGHTEEKGYCTGGVLLFLNCQEVLVEDCGLFGCGTLGVTGDRSRNIQIVNNDIYECTDGGVKFSNCEDVNVDGNTFRDLGGAELLVYGCSNITCNGEPVHDFTPCR